MAKIVHRGDFMKDLTSEFLSGNTTDVADIITFVEAPWGLNFKLFPVQKFILKCMYNIPLDSVHKTIRVPDVCNEVVLYEFTETEFLHWLHEEGRCNTDDVAGKNFRELIMVLGRRSGKSSISSCISCYELYKLVKRSDPSEYYKFPPDTNICVMNVAPTDDQASVVFNMITNMALTCPFLRDRSVNKTMTYFNLQTDSDERIGTRKKQASIVAVSGGCSSNALRGRNNIVVILDEMAFFIDNNGRFSGLEVYKALTPSTASFKGDGKIICSSSPYAKYGAFWDRYASSFNETDTTVMFKMYTALVNPEIDSAILKTERRRDKIAFLGEYGGEFSDQVTAWVDDEEQFCRCIARSRKISEKGMFGTEYFMGIDLGARNDGTALAVVHRDHESKKIILDHHKLWFSASSDVWDVDKSIYHRDECRKYADIDVLSFASIAEEIKNLCLLFPVKSGWFDQWSGYALMELLHNMGLKQFYTEAVTDKINSEMYQLLKSLYVEQMIDFYNDDLVVGEILSLEADKKSKNKISVRAPNKKGAHDDLSDAITRAVWAVFNGDNSRSRPLTCGGSMNSMLGSVAQYNSFHHMKQQLHGPAIRSRPTIKRKF